MNRIVKKILTILGLTVCLGVTILIGIGNIGVEAEKTDDIGIVNTSDPEVKKFYELGKQNKKNLEDQDYKRWKRDILGTDNVIDGSKVNVITGEMQEIVGEDIDNDVSDELKSSQALYIAAKNEDIRADKKEVDDAIEFVRSICSEKDNEMGEYIKAYCKGAGITLEEYLSYLRPFYEKRIVVSKYVENSAQSELEKNNVSTGTPEAIEIQNDVRDKLEKEAMEKYDVTIDGEQ